MSDWESKLDALLAKREQGNAAKEEGESNRRAENEACFLNVIIPALNEFKSKMENKGRKVELQSGSSYAYILVKNGMDAEFEVNYSIEGDQISVKPEYVDNEKGGKYRSLHGLSSSATKVAVLEQLISFLRT